MDAGKKSSEKYQTLIPKKNTLFKLKRNNVGHALSILPIIFKVCSLLAMDFRLQCLKLKKQILKEKEKNKETSMMQSVAITLQKEL